MTVEDLIAKKKNAFYFKKVNNSKYSVVQNVEIVKVLIGMSPESLHISLMFRELSRLRVHIPRPH